MATDRSRLRRSAAGFTLLELVVATVIMVTVLMICYQILGSTLSASERIERRSRPDKIGEAIMALIRRDLQGAVWYQLGDTVFLGEDFGAEDSALAQTLAGHFGAGSPLMTLLSPTESQGFLAALGGRLEESLGSQRERILRE